MWPFSTKASAASDRKGMPVSALVAPGNWNTPVTHYTRLMGAAEQFRLVESNLTASTVVRRIAAQAAGVKFYVENPDGEPDWEHPVSELLSRIDDEIGRSAALYQMAISLQVTGDAFLRKVDGVERVPARANRRDRQERRVPVPQSLQLIQVQDVSTNIDTATDRIQTYNVTSNGGMFQVGVEDMVHVRQHWPTVKHEGLSILCAVAGHMGALNSIVQIQQELLSNGAMPPAILSIVDEDGELDATQFESLRRDLEGFRTGGNRQGQFFILRGKFQLEEPPRLTDLISLQQIEHLEDRICNGFGYPPILLRSGEGVTYENQEQAKVFLWEQTIIPMILEPIASALSLRLGLPIAFDLSGTPIEAAQTNNSWKRQKEAADVMTINERRRMLGEDPLPAGGNVIFRNAGLIAYQEDQDPNDLPEPTEPEATEQADAITAALDRYLSKHGAPALCDH